MGWETGVNSTLLSDTLQSIGLVESASGRGKVWFRKKTMDLCTSNIEEDEDGVGPCVNGTLLQDTLKSIGLGESVTRTKVWLKKKPILNKNGVIWS